MSATLFFTSRVLGPGPAAKLKDGKVLQTVRSRKEAAPFLSKCGSDVAVALDGQPLYQARITSIKARNLGALDQFDAELGGFEQLSEFELAVRRAGFRFKPLKEYEVFAIQIQKVGKEAFSE